MKKNMLKSLLLSTLCMAVALTSFDCMASGNVKAKSNTSSTSATSTSKVGTQTTKKEKTNRQREIEAHTQRAKEWEEDLPRLESEKEKWTAEVKKWDEKIKELEDSSIEIDEDGSVWEVADVQRDRQLEEYKKQRDRAKRELDEVLDAIDFETSELKKEQRIRDKYIAQEEGLFASLMWDLKDKDSDVAEGKLSQRSKLSDETRVAQKTLKIEDRKVRRGAFAQTENMAVNEDDQEILWAEDEEVKSGAFAQTGKMAVGEEDEAKTKDLAQKNNDTQKQLMSKDKEVKGGAFAQTENMAVSEDDVDKTKKLAQTDNYTQDYLVGKDYEVWDASAAGEHTVKLGQEDNYTQDYLVGKDYEVWANSAAGYHTVKLGLEDRDIQYRLIGLDYEVWDLSAMGYHWWTMDYGLARELALRPLEFGYFSYHAALHDTMGGYSSAEMLYSTIFDIASLGVGALNGVSGVIKGVESIVDAVGNFRREDLVKDINDAQTKKEEAKARANSFDDLTIDANNQAQKLLGTAEKAEEDADYYARKSQEYDDIAKAAYEKEQYWKEQGREDLAETERINKEKALIDSADMWNRSLEEGKKANDARDAAATYQSQAEGYWKKKEAADAAYDYYDVEENKAKQKLRDLVGVSDANTDVARSENRMAQAEQGKAQADAALAEASASKQKYSSSYEQSMRDSQEAEREADEWRLAAGNASKIGDSAAYTELSQKASEASRKADQYKADAATAKMIADSYSREEERLQNVSADYAAQISTEKEYQASAKATQGVKEAEYAVLTGTATEEQRKLYEQSKQYEESQKLSKQADDWAKKIPTPGEVVRTVEGGVSRGSGDVLEWAEGTGAVGSTRTITDTVGTTKKLFNW